MALIFETAVIRIFLTCERRWARAIEQAAYNVARKHEAGIDIVSAIMT